ncbi:hypothetical protein GCM10027360_19270 [Amycolatopsis echigonensis]
MAGTRQAERRTGTGRRGAGKFRPRHAGTPAEGPAGPGTGVGTPVSIRVGISTVSTYPGGPRR